MIYPFSRAVFPELGALPLLSSGSVRICSGDLRCGAGMIVGALDPGTGLRSSALGGRALRLGAGTTIGPPLLSAIGLISSARGGRELRLGAGMITGESALLSFARGGPGERTC